METIMELETKRSWQPDLVLVPWLVVGVTLSFVIPNSGFQSNDWLSVILKSIATVVPSIQNVSNLSSNPEFVKTFLSFMWLLAPLQFYILIHMRDVLFPHEKWQERKRTLLASSISLASLFIFVSVFELGSNGLLGYDPQTGRGILRPMLSSKIGMGVFGSLIIFFTLYAVTAALTFMNRYREEYGAKSHIPTI